MPPCPVVLGVCLLLAADPPVPAGVRADRDLPYAGTDNPRQRLDLLRPTTPADAGPLPVVVFIHGGAWLSGDKGSGWNHLTSYVTSGRYAGVSVGYRLTGEAIWPAQVHDCKAAVRWVRANAQKYNLDPDRVGVMGSSAGGHLAAMLAVGGGVPALEGALGPHPGTDSRVRCGVILWGPSDLPGMSGQPGSMDHDSPQSPESRLIGGAVPQNKPAARAASPVAYVSADDPPLLLVHGTADPLVPFDQSERLRAAYKAVGRPVNLVRVEGGGHGNFRDRTYRDRARQFFDHHLRGSGEPPADETRTEPPKK